MFLFVTGTDRDLEEIDWSELKEESKTYWKNLELGAYLKLTFTAIIGLGFSSLDLVKDCILASKYIGGDYYQSRSIQTFEKDPFWGGITLALVFLPGFALLVRLLSKEGNRSPLRVFIIILASLLFPFTLIFTKLYQLFQFGEEWNRVGTLLTTCENQVETFLQAILQLYILYSRPDREASIFQWLAIIGSFVMIGFGQARAAFANRTAGASMSEDIKKMAKFTFVSSFMIYNFIFTAVYIAIFDKILFFVNYGIIVILPFIYLFLTRLKSSCLPQNDTIKRKLKLIMLSTAFLIVTNACVIGLVLFNMDPIRYSRNFFNTALGIYSAVYLIFFILFLLYAIFSIELPFKDFLK